MVGLTFELWWYDSVLGRSIRGNFTQQRITDFWCGNAYFDDGCAHIFPFPCQILSENMLTICHDSVFYVSNKRLDISTYLLFCALQFWYSSFFQKCSRHDNNDEYMILADMQHSHPHMTLYRKFFFKDGVKEYFVMLNHWWWFYCLRPLPFSFHLLLDYSSRYYEVLMQKLTIITLDFFQSGLPSIET